MSTPKNTRWTESKPCLWCRTRTMNANQHCNVCSTHLRDAETYEPSYDDALVGGAWKRRGLVHIWERAS